MADEDSSLKRARCETGDTPPAKQDTQSKGSLTLDSLLEERVRALVAQALSSHSPSSTAPLAEAGPFQQELAACRSEIAAQKAEIEELKKEQGATRSLVQTLQKTIKDLKTGSSPSEQKSEGRAIGADLAGNLTLKVGSRKFQTTAETLRTFSESFFGLMVSGRIPQKCEKDGSIFVDRNPKHFSFVLDYLRSGGEGFTPPTSTSAQDELRVEADFYGLPGLVTTLRRLHVAAHHLMTVGKKGAVLSGHKLSAAMLDVQDPNNFSVTLGLSKFGTSSEIFVGVAPADTALSSEWVKRQRSQDANVTWECPPAMDHGLFFFVDGANVGLVTASDGKFHRKNQRGWRHYINDTIESIGICFHRGDEGCKVTFNLVKKNAMIDYGSRVQTIKWDTSITDHGLQLTAEYRPMLFLGESGTVTIAELAG